MGCSEWVGYSFAWASKLYSVTGNGEAAAYQLKLFWENCRSVNGFHLNGDFKHRGVLRAHYRPFTLEGNFAVISALQDMLISDLNGCIQLFPAIPDEWRRRFTTIRPA